MAELALLLEGQRLSGWTALSVTRSVETLAATFGVQTALSRRFSLGEAVEVLLDEQRVVSGYVDAVNPRFSPQGGSVEIRGRDRSADLVDCAPDLRPAEWRNVRLDEMAAILAAPFGISVRVGPGADVGDPFPKVALAQGQRCWDLLDQLGRNRDVVMTSDGSGAVVVGAIGAEGASEPLEEGVNVLSASLSASERDRFSEYVVKGQPDVVNFLSTEAPKAPVGKATDPGVDRYRPMVLVASGALDDARAQAQAEREATVRAARALRLAVTVPEWTQGNGELWRPNQRTAVLLPTLNLEGEFVVAGCEYRSDVTGTVTNLSLLPPEAFQANVAAIGDAGGFGLA